MTYLGLLKICPVFDVIRFNTEGASAPIWAIRTTLSGDATAENDNFRIQNRGDAD